MNDEIKDTLNLLSNPTHHPLKIVEINKHSQLLSDYFEVNKGNLVSSLLEFNKYIEKWKDEPFYTLIPPIYFVIPVLVSSFVYVKYKLNLNKEHKLTWQELLKSCSLFPEIFSYYMLGITLRPYQVYDLEFTIKNRYVVKAWSRRLGKSFDNRIYLLWSVFFNKLHSELGGTTWNIILQDQDTGNDIYIEPLHELMERGDLIVRRNFKGKLGDKYFTSKLTTPRDKTGKVRANKISFRIPPDPITETKAGICRITTYPPTKKAIGHEGNIIGDEVSKWKENNAVKDEFKFFDQLTAILKDNPNYKAIFSSTPEGDSDLFAEIFNPNENTENKPKSNPAQPPQNKYNKLWFSYWFRTDNSWINEMTKTKNEAITKGRLQLFQQEFEAKFISIHNSFFNTEYILQNIIQSNPPPSKYFHSIGIDWGGTMKSQTAIVITKWDLNENNPRYTHFVKTYPINKDTELFLPDIQLIKQQFNPKWITVDNKGARWLIPQLKQIFPGRVNEFNFTTDKRAGYEKLRNALIQHKLKLPPNKELISQLSTLTDELKPNSSKNKDDIADALMLSIQPLFNNNKTKFNIILY